MEPARKKRKEGEDGSDDEAESIELMSTLFRANRQQATVIEMARESVIAAAKRRAFPKQRMYGDIEASDLTSLLPDTTENARLRIAARLTGNVEAYVRGGWGQEWQASSKSRPSSGAAHRAFGAAEKNGSAIEALLWDTLRDIEEKWPGYTHREQWPYHASGKAMSVAGAIDTLVAMVENNNNY